MYHSLTTGALRRLYLYPTASVDDSTSAVYSCSGSDRDRKLKKMRQMHWQRRRVAGRGTWKICKKDFPEAWINLWAWDCAWCDMILCGSGYSTTGTHSEKIRVPDNEGFANLVGDRPGTRCDTHTSKRDGICEISWTWAGGKLQFQPSNPLVWNMASALAWAQTLFLYCFRSYSIARWAC